MQAYCGYSSRSENFINNVGLNCEGLTNRETATTSGRLNALPVRITECELFPLTSPSKCCHSLMTMPV